MQLSDKEHEAGGVVVAASKSRTRTCVVLGIALGLRLLVLWTVLTRYPKGWLFTRGLEMGLLAKSIVDGQGLSSPFGPVTGPTAFIAPGYPLLIAGVFHVFGAYSIASAVVVMLLQIALNLVTISLVMGLARQLAGDAAAWIAGLIWACSLPLIWIPTIFWDTSIAICLFTGFLALVLHLQARMTASIWMLLGAYVAVASLINPAMLPSLAGILVWLAWQQRPASYSNLLLAGAVFCLVYSPWPIRNYKVFHAFIPLRTTVGFELWMGNRPGATGYLDESLFPSFNAHELGEYRAVGELAYTAHKAELAKAYIINHPDVFTRLTAVRFGRFWVGTGSSGGSALFALHAAFTAFFGLLGLALLGSSRRRSIAFLMAVPLLLFPLPYYITHAEFRYRLAVDPLLTVLSAYALVTLWRRVATRTRTSSAAIGEAMMKAHG